MIVFLLKDPDFYAINSADYRLLKLYITKAKFKIKKNIIVLNKSILKSQKIGGCKCHMTYRNKSLRQTI